MKIKEENYLLEARNLKKSFGGVVAINNVDFFVKKGEIVGIIGPNGSGKTTLINLITGFVKKDTGKVKFKNYDISNWKPDKIINIGIARTFQIMRPFYNLPAYKNLIPALYSPRAKKVGTGKFGDRDSVAIDLLEEVGFERDAYVPYKPAGSLPLGYLKRLELARCLALNPEFLITDEIFSGLTVAEISSLLPLIEKLNLNGLTIVMIEHRLKELFKIANRIIVLNFGEKIADGVTEEVMKLPEVKKAYLGEEWNNHEK